MPGAPKRNLPFPTHLRGFVRPIQRTSRPDHLLTGRLRCPCGAVTFRVLFPGKLHRFLGELTPCTIKVGGAFFFLIHAVCAKCERRHVVLDVDLHGWNGYVCHDAKQAALPRCHRVVVDVTSQGRKDFIEEAGPDFPVKRWVDGFESLSLDLTCAQCGLVTPTWTACETM